MVFSLSACGRQKIDTVIYEDESDGDFLDTSDPVYAQVESMINPVLQFVEYNHILGNTVNYQDVTAEDFWNIVAIVVSSYDKIDSYANVDVAGVYHLEWNTMLEFAKTFLFDTIFKNSTPNYHDSYSASADPGSGVIDLIPLGVDNFDASLVEISKATDSADYEYVLHVDLTSRDAKPQVHHYHVYLADWKEYLKDFYNLDDTDEHIMPYVVVGYTFEGTDESED